MTRPQAIFFDMHGTLVDSEVLHPQYTAALAEVCSQRFGGPAHEWAAANRQAFARWKELAADLDFRGPEGMRHRALLAERCWRATFEALERPAPDMDFAAFESAMGYEFTRRSDALYPDAREPLARLARAGLALHAISDADNGHIRGCLEGAGVAHLFAGFHGSRDVGLGLKQPEYFARVFRRAGVGPSEALVVDDSAECVLFAHEAGARVVMLRREGRVQPAPETAETIAQAGQVAVAVLPGLGGLADLVLAWRRGAQGGLEGASEP